MHRQLISMPPLVLLILAALLTPAGARLDPLAASRQCVVVTSPAWSSSTATLQRWERRADGGWRREGRPIQVMVGREGMAWGRGVYPPSGLAGPVKREGDLRTPAGIFTLGPMFGHGGTRGVNGGLPFVPIVEGTEFVDDPASHSYNRIVRPGTPRDWKSSEPMRIPEYRLGIVVGHNPAPAAPGVGSCIVLHILSGPGVPTRGCTAMDEADLRTVGAWLRASANPLLVQLPGPAYGVLRGRWSLP